MAKYSIRIEGTSAKSVAHRVPKERNNLTVMLLHQGHISEQNEMIFVVIILYLLHVGSGCVPAWSAWHGPSHERDFPSCPGWVMWEQTLWGEAGSASGPPSAADTAHRLVASHHEWWSGSPEWHTQKNWVDQNSYWLQFKTKQKTLNKSDLWISVFEQIAWMNYSMTPS